MISLKGFYLVIYKSYDDECARHIRQCEPFLLKKKQYKLKNKYDTKCNYIEIKHILNN